MKTGHSCGVEAPVTLRELADLLPKQEDALEKQDEGKYVDMESGGVKGKKEKDGDLNQISLLVHKSSGGGGAPCVTEPKREAAMEQKEARGLRGSAGAAEEDQTDQEPPAAPVPAGVDAEVCLGSGDMKSARLFTQQQQEEEEEEDVRGDKELQQCGDNYLTRRNECDEDEEDEEDDDDDVTLVLSDDCAPCALDESHYITTHEIQLSELSDHEGDYDLRVDSSTSWDVEDDSRVYAFVDYASFDGDGDPKALESDDLCDAAKFATTSSDESASKPPQPQPQIHLSIRTTSRAINDSGNIQDEGNIFYHARRAGDVSRYVFRGVDGKADALCDKAKCFIAAPGRLHFGGRLRGKEVTDYSSGASSAVSELDDADKEVRTLTARAFKSLAYPNYFDAINFSASSDSSASAAEHRRSGGVNMNRWSTFFDVKYGNLNLSQHQQQQQQLERKSLLSNQKSFEIAKSIETMGSSSSSINNNKKTFTPASAQKVELMGKLSERHSEVIRLTETLNFRCNVNNAGMSRAGFAVAQNAVGSRSADEVTIDSLLPLAGGGQSRAAPSNKPPGPPSSSSKTMEDSHKKAIFASSLLKNVISKKMQFEQERKMERGEIREAPYRHHQAPSSPGCCAHPEGDAHRGKLQRQSSRFSESSSDYAIMCADELGDFVDSGSCDSRRQDAAAPASLQTNLDPGNEVGIDTKKGALEASKSTLLRSQNSAFRCWKDGRELEFQKDNKNDKGAEEKSPSARDKEWAEWDQQRSAAGSGKLTKMSHLFVPSIQLLSSEGEVGQQLRAAADYSPLCGGDEGRIQLRSDSNTLYVADPRSVTTSKSPEIKINLRSVRDNKTEPFGVSKLRAPNIGCNSTRTDDFKCQALASALRAESSDKVPHFMVRDIRDNKGKLQTPIHQVRDVRKLVKSSYHFVSLDNNENRPSDSHSEGKKQVPYRNTNSVSPIVIKCQSVNTNTNGKPPGKLELAQREPVEVDRSSPEGAKAAQPQWATTGKTPSSSSEGSVGLRIESSVATSSRKQEKTSEAMAEKKPESKLSNQVALQKLQAAVKTMEQLYVFEKNEWKRKNEPQPLVDSHVLSLLAEEHGPEEDVVRGFNVGKMVRRDSLTKVEKIGGAAAAASPSIESPIRSLQKSQQTSSGKNMFSLNSSLKASSTTAKMAPQNSATQMQMPTPFSSKNFPNVPKSPKQLPVSLKISQPRFAGHDATESKEDNENYLTIPVKSHATTTSGLTGGGVGKQPPYSEKTSVYTSTTQSHPATPPGHFTRVQEDVIGNQTPRRSSIVMETCSTETPSATIYHSLPMGLPAANQPQVYCFSPTITPAPTIDAFQATQRKMLLDPTTGNYYLVDTPVQPATKRLFDPESGQYVDVPMPQPPMTPVPMAMSPLALSPGAYGPTYMIYQGFMPATPSVIPARSLVQSQMSMQSEAAESMEKALSQQPEGMYIESPFYMATGKSTQTSGAPQHQHIAAATSSSGRPLQGFGGVKQPVISITSQQGPRIVAPPSFDGTTMSFVVEHR